MRDIMEREIRRMLKELKNEPPGSENWVNIVDGISKLVKPVLEYDAKVQVGNIDAEAKVKAANIDAETKERISEQERLSRQEEFAIRAKELQEREDKQLTHEIWQAIARIGVESVVGVIGIFSTRTILRHEDLRLAQVMHFEETGAISPQLLRMVESRKKV